MNQQVDRLRRDMRNNGRIYEDAAKILKESVVSCAKISKRYNATYDEEDFNDGLLQAAMLDARSADAAPPQEMPRHRLQMTGIPVTAQATNGFAISCQ